ncbi:MAG: sodium:solute symporter family protein [Oscillospiraceae bacterium]|nr:sodium:solute symporter family protein [Oscillospiraceae bacterium]
MNIYLVVFIIYFAIIIITSIIGAKKVESMGDFTSGGGNMGLILGIGTSVATWLSVASVMGVPGTLYARGIAAVFGWIAGWFLGTAIMPIIAYKVRRPAVPTRTFPEFIHLRYDPYNDKSKIQVFVAVIELCGYFVFAFIQVQGFGIVLSTISGLSYAVCCVLFMVILVFTCLGGFMSVARTDTVNAILILIGVITGMITVLQLTGGMGNIVQNFITTTAPAIEGGDPLTPGILGTAWGTFGFSTILSTFLSNSIGATVAPHWIARFMAPRNAKTAALQMFWVVIALIPVFVPLVIIGMGGKMLLPSLPVGTTTDYMFPTLIVKFLNPVLGALALTAICAAAVSTANSMLLHCSTSLIYDIKRVIQNKAPSEGDDERTTKQLRYCILALGVIAVLCAIGKFTLLAQGFTYIYGAFGSTFFWVTWLGLFTKRMNKPAAFASMISGLFTYMLFTTIGAPFHLPLFFCGAGVSLVFALIFMFATKKPPVEAYEAYMSDNPSEATIAVIHRIRKDAM